MDEQRNSRRKLFSIVHHIHMLAIVYFCLHAYQLMIQWMREKENQVHQELKAQSERDRDKLLYRLAHGGRCCED